MKKVLENIDINSIQSPNDVKKLSLKDCDALAAHLREEIIRITSLYGGHLSSNLGTVELTIALARVFDFPKDKLIFDVGHQSYAWKILTGRNLEYLNEKGKVSGFQKINEGPFDAYEAGHSGTAASAALAFLDARELKRENYEIIAVVGDGAIGNGLTLEALNDLGRRKSRVIIILNDNDMAISPSRGALSHSFRSISLNKGYLHLKAKCKTSLLARKKKGTFNHLKSFRDWVKNVLVGSNFFDDLGFLYLGPFDGHNIKEMENVFQKVKRVDTPVVIHIKTKKGKGYSLAELDEDGYWHGVTPFDPTSGKPKETHPDEISWSHVMGDMTEVFMEDKKNVLICPAMAKGSHLENCFRKYPERCFDPGIAEEHALTYAGALSLAGFHPIVSIYSTFLQRAYDELLHDCARMNASMTLLIDRAGLCGKNGDTHQGIYDPAFLMSIPHIIVTMPRSFDDALSLYEESLSSPHIIAIRYPHTLEKKENLKSLKVKKDIFSWKIEGEDDHSPIFMGVGPLGLALEKRLKEKKLPYRYLDFSLLYPFDEKAISSLLKANKIFLYDPYSTRNGFITHLEAHLLEKGYQGEIAGYAVNNDYIAHASLTDQLQDLGLDLETMEEKAIRFLKE